MIPFGVWAPDQGRFTTGTSPNVVNAIPLGPLAWGPLPGTTEISEALAAACLGAIAVRDSSGSYHIFAGTATKLYKLDPTDYSWDDVSRLAGGNYAVPDGDRWSFAVFGTTLVAVNLADAPQSIDIDSPTNFAALAGSPPQAKFVWVAGEHLVLGHISTFPTRIQTSALGDAATWTVGLRGADVQEFPDGEEIMGGIGSEKGAIIFQKRMIRQMVVGAFGEGGRYSFRTEVINPSRGVIAPYSIVQVGPMMPAYLSSDGFCLGVDGKPIGSEVVDQFFFANADADSIVETRGMVDPYKKIIWWQVPLNGGESALLGYNYKNGRWCYAEDDIEEMVDLTTPAITIDGLDLLYATIDDVTPAFDSRLFTGGLPLFAVFTTDHHLATLTGAPKAATFDTWEMQHTPGRRTFVKGVRPVLDATTFTMKIASASRYSGSAMSFGTAVSPNTRSGMCEFRSDGLLHQYRLQIAAGETWTQVDGLDDFDLNPSGLV